MRLALLPSLIMTLGVLAAAPPAQAQPASQSPGCCTATTRDVEKVGGNLGNQNYSALRQINKANVKQLGAIWLNNIEGGITTGTNQSTTIVKDGVIYIESALGRVHAVDGVTGQTKWVYPGKGTITRRGPAVGQGMVYTIATGNTVVALNKDTGQVVWEKQINGYGNMAKVGVVYHDGMLYLGTNDGTRGAALAVDAGTGELKWYFFGIPGPGEFGYDTWGGGPQSGATPWIHPAVDPELNLVYWTFGNARGGSSQDGSQRPRPEPVRQLHRRHRRQDRRLQVALPVRAPRHLGHGQRQRARAGGRDRQGPAAQGRHLRQQDGHVVHPGPHRRHAADRHRRETRAAGRAPEHLARRSPIRAATPGCRSA
ncbi:MAG: PQQ-binding-like beta-propeller repeat protein [Pseudorhodoferax sp.]